MSDRTERDHRSQSWLAFAGGRAEWPLERRLKVANDLAAVPKKFRLPLAFGWVPRAKFPYYTPFPNDMPEPWPGRNCAHDRIHELRNDVGGVLRLFLENSLSPGVWMVTVPGR
jgi:hypothetical protein